MKLAVIDLNAIIDPPFETIVNHCRALTIVVFVDKGLINAKHGLAYPQSTAA